jgi:hypothetical protein
MGVCVGRLLQDEGLDFLCHAVSVRRSESGVGIYTFEGDAQFQEFMKGGGEVVEEFLLIGGICIDPFLEGFILISLAAWVRLG